MDNRDRILEALLAAGGEYVSGQALGRALGISRAAVHRHIANMQAGGYGIESVSGRGYRLTGRPDRLDPPRIGALLATRRLGRTVRCLERVDSTNRYLRRWAEEGAPDGALALAEEQTAGSGRRGRRWLCAPRTGLMMSFLLRPDMRPDEVQKVTLAAAVAVAEEIAGLCPAPGPAIKWPNDILLGGRKVCGILTQMSAAVEAVAWIVVGIGVNVRGAADGLPPEIRETATTLEAGGCGPVDRNALAAGICNRFEALWSAWIGTGSFDGVLERYRGRMAWLGRPVRLTLDGAPLEGILEGVDGDGLLLVGTGGGTARIRSGEVTLRRNER